MSSSFEKDFCGGAFWNTTLTWDSEHPDFTKCFHKTILSWCPIVVLLFFSSLELPNYFSSNNPNRKIPWSPLTIIKLCATSGLVIVNIAEFILIGVTDSDDDPLTDVYPVDYITASVFLLSYILSLDFLILAIRYGIRTSTAQFFFYLISVICEGINFRSAVRRITHPEEEETYPVSEHGSKILIGLVSFQYGLIIILFILNFFADKEPEQYDEKLKNIPNLSPEISASFPSKLTFFWATPLLWKGYRNTLNPAMLWSMNPKITSEGVVPHFDACFNREVEIVNKKKQTTSYSELPISEKELEKAKISILFPLIKTFGPEFLIGSCLKVCHDLLATAAPQIMDLIIEYVTMKYCDPDMIDKKDGQIECNAEEKETAYNWKGYLFAGLLLATTICQSILLNQYFVRMYIVSMKIKTALTSAIYRKALVMSNSARKESTVGEIVNLMSVDVQKFMVRYDI